MDITIIVVNWNSCDLLKNCLQSIQETVHGLSYEIIVVDNASNDGSVEMLRKAFPQARVIENRENRGFGAANNQALRNMTGRYALLLNSDTVLTKNAVRGLWGFMESRPDAAMVCGQLLNEDGSRQNSVAAFPSLLTLMTNISLLEYLFPRRFPSKRHDYPEPVEVDSAIGACLMVRKSAIDSVGMFDERYFFFFEETDWARQMRVAGWKVFYLSTAYIYHLQGRSVGRNVRSRILFYRSRDQYFRKWENTSTYRLIRMVVFIRLAMNWFLTACGVFLTLGLHRGMRDKGLIYGSLLGWYLRGCP